MASKLESIGLTSLDDLFKTGEERQAEQGERVQIVPADKVFPYARQPYSVDRPTPDLVRLMDSIERNGIAEPMIVRPREGGTYEIIAGHRRDYCAKAVGLETRPVIVREYTDEQADILVVDYNNNREDLLPSEKARAYKLKLDAMKRQGERSDLTSAQVGQKLDEQTARALVAQEAGTSRNQVQRYIRLNSLEQPLLEKVDNGELAFTPAVELSYLNPEEQGWVRSALETTQQTPSLSQAQRIKQESKEGKLTEESVLSIMSEEKKPLYNSVTLSHDTLKKYFPRSYTAKQMEKVIIKLLDNWLKKRQQEQQR